MAQPYIGEIRMFAGNFAPVGWMFCDGQLLPISENETLFNLIGTTYGGDGQSTFALPNLQSRVPIQAWRNILPRSGTLISKSFLRLQSSPARVSLQRTIQFQLAKATVFWLERIRSQFDF